MIDPKHALDDILFPGGDACPVTIHEANKKRLRNIKKGEIKDARRVSKCLGHGPHGFRPLPATHEQAIGKLVHTGADVFEGTLAVVTATVAVVGGAYRSVVQGSLAGSVSMKEKYAPPLVREGDIVSYHVSILHDDVGSRSVFRPEVVFAIPGVRVISA